MADHWECAAPCSNVNDDEFDFCLYCGASKTWQCDSVKCRESAVVFKCIHVVCGKCRAPKPASAGPIVLVAAPAVPPAPGAPPPPAVVPVEAEPPAPSAIARDIHTDSHDDQEEEPFPELRTLEQRNQFFQSLNLAELRNKSDKWKWKMLNSFGDLPALRKFARTLQLQPKRKCSCLTLQCLRAQILCNINQNSLLNGDIYLTVATKAKGQGGDGQEKEAGVPTNYLSVLEACLDTTLAIPAIGRVPVAKVHFLPEVLSKVTRSLLAKSHSVADLLKFGLRLPSSVLPQAEANSRLFLAPNNLPTLTQQLDSGMSLENCISAKTIVKLEPEVLPTCEKCDQPCQHQKSLCVAHQEEEDNGTGTGTARASTGATRQAMDAEMPMPALVGSTQVAASQEELDYSDVEIEKVELPQQDESQQPPNPPAAPPEYHSVVEFAGVTGEGRALRSRQKAIVIGVENVEEGKILCPHPTCAKKGIGFYLTPIGCKVMSCTNHVPSFFLFCVHCKIEVKDPSNPPCSCIGRCTIKDILWQRKRLAEAAEKTSSNKKKQKRGGG